MPDSAPKIDLTALLNHHGGGLLQCERWERVAVEIYFTENETGYDTAKHFANALKLQGCRVGEVEWRGRDQTYFLRAADLAPSVLKALEAAFEDARDAGNRSVQGCDIINHLGVSRPSRSAPYIP